MPQKQFVGKGGLFAMFSVYKYCVLSFTFLQAMNATLEHQRNLAKAKLEARRRRREDKRYEEDIATSLLMMAEKESSLAREKTMIQRSKQGESVSTRCQETNILQG